MNKTLSQKRKHRLIAQAVSTFAKLLFSLQVTVLLVCVYRHTNLFLWPLLIITALIAGWWSDDAAVVAWQNKDDSQ